MGIKGYNEIAVAEESTHAVSIIIKLGSSPSTGVFSLQYIYSNYTQLNAPATTILRSHRISPNLHFTVIGGVFVCFEIALKLFGCLLSRENILFRLRCECAARRVEAKETKLFMYTRDESASIMAHSLSKLSILIYNWRNN